MTAWEQAWSSIESLRDTADYVKEPLTEVTLRSGATVAEAIVYAADTIAAAIDRLRTGASE